MPFRRATASGTEALLSERRTLLDVPCVTRETVGCKRSKPKQAEHNVVLKHLKSEVHRLVGL